jgi:probable rRNA maturation factor
MDVFVANEQEISVNEARSAALVRHTLSSEDLDENSELSVLFVTADHIRRLNKRFAGNDYSTDVLAFPMMDEDEETFLLGDVVVCPSIAEENAHKAGHAVEREIDTLLVHGTLHLLGYDHQGVDDKARMDKRVNEVLASFMHRAAQ